MGHWEVSGVDSFNAGLDELAARVNAATDETVDDVLDLIQTETTANLSITAHAPLMQTDSLPGEPPADVTGGLIRSLRPTRDPSTGDGVYSGRFGPTTVYSRIQELGGTIHGRPLLSWQTFDGEHFHRHFAASVTLPPRPYLKPAVDEIKDEVRELFKTAWDDALHG